jgi:hypothetical protein
MFTDLSDLELFDLMIDCFRDYLTHGNRASKLEYLERKLEVLKRMSDVH